MNEIQQPERMDLRVRTKRLALRVIRLYAALPRCVEAEVIGKQLLKSATSVSELPDECNQLLAILTTISKKVKSNQG